jgi:uncharacterized membrane protein
MSLSRSAQLESNAHEAVMDVLSWVVLGINTICAAVLIWGVIVGVVMFLRAELQRRVNPLQKWPALRQIVGQYLLFALELLIAADIIETMIRPTLDQIAILGGVSALRIITGYALGKELQHLGDAPVSVSPPAIASREAR